MVCFESNVSNGIKFFTQSLFSHTNFFFSREGLTIGAEDLRSIVCLDYRNKRDENFYYVAKRLDLDYLARVFSFEYAGRIYRKIGKTSEDRGSFLLRDKFVEYVLFRESLGADVIPPLAVLLGKAERGYPESERDEVRERIDRFMEAKRESRPSKTIVPGYQGAYLAYLREFLLLGILRRCVKSYGRTYDLEGTLSTAITPWNEPGLDSREYFCSEFVVESLLYAGFYPFDIDTKTPESVSPGDIMDMSVLFGPRRSANGSYDTDSTRLYRLSKERGFEPVMLSGDDTIKSHILRAERRNMYFQKQQMAVNAYRSIMKLVALRSRTKEGGAEPEKVPSRRVRVGHIGMFLLSGAVIGWYGSGSVTVLKTSLGESGRGGVGLADIWGDLHGLIALVAANPWTERVTGFFSGLLLLALKTALVGWVLWMLFAKALPYGLAVWARMRGE